MLEPIPEVSLKNYILEPVLNKKDKTRIMFPFQSLASLAISVRS